MGNQSSDLSGQKPSLSDIRTLAQKGVDEPYTLGRLYGSRISCYATWLFARTTLSPNAVTLIGVTCGLAAALLLIRPLTMWTALTLGLLFQASYVLDFSDGELARLRRRPSHAGSYLDWLGHLYVPTLSVGLLGLQVGDALDNSLWTIMGIVAAVGMGNFHFSCKEHIAVAFLRRHPGSASHGLVQNALLDRPQPLSNGVRLAQLSVMSAARPRGGLRIGLQQAMGATLIYPGAMHLLTAAVVVDAVSSSLAGRSLAIGRTSLLVIWSLVLTLHAFVAVGRNYRVLQGLDTVADEIHRTTS